MEDKQIAVQIAGGAYAPMLEDRKPQCKWLNSRAFTRSDDRRWEAEAITWSNKSATRNRGNDVTPLFLLQKQRRLLPQCR